ncbi:hypothetical protein ACQY0O_006658 [Thecaphora frezii]
MDTIRTRSLTFLLHCLSSTSHSSSLPSFAEGLESAIFQKHGSTNNAYRNEVRSKGLTLKKDNPQLVTQLVEGRVSVETLARWEEEEMKSPHQSKRDEELRKQGLQNAIGVDDFATDVTSTTQPTLPPRDEEDLETYGEAKDAEMGGGGEGEFKARAQPKVGEAMRGVEFETGM